MLGFVIASGLLCIRVSALPLRMEMLPAPPQLLHMCRGKRVTRFKLAELGADPFRCFGGRGVRSLLEAPGIKLADFCAGEG